MADTLSPAVETASAHPTGGGWSSRPAPHPTETAAAAPSRGVSTGTLAPAEETLTAAPAAPLGVWVWRPAVDTGVAAATRGWSVQALRQAGSTETGFRLNPVSVLALPIAAEIDLALPTSPVVSDAAWTEAIGDQERVPVYELRADWARTGNYDHPCSDLTDLAEEVTVTRDLAGSLPAEVGIVEGHSAAKLTTTLSGYWPGTETDPVDAFAPYKTTAALYGRPIIGTPLEFYSGFNTREGPQQRRQFTGSVARVNPSSAARDVAVDGLDPANRLRAPISIAPIGMDSLLLAKYGPDRYLSRFNSQWLVDHIFRANGIYASPPAREDAVLSVTMHGSPIPEIGAGFGPEEYAAGSPQTRDAWSEEGHPFGMLGPHPLAPVMDGWWITEEPVTMAAGTGLGFSAWIRMPADPFPVAKGLVSLGPSREYNFLSYELTAAGAPNLSVVTDAGQYPELAPSSWTRPAVPTWMFVGMHAAFRPGQVDMTLRVGGQTYRTTQAATIPADTQWLPRTRVDYGMAVPMTNVQVWSAPAAPISWVGETWIPQADLDPGLNEWTGIPQIVNEDSWKLLTEVVAAEFGAVGFDPDGRGWFRSRARRRPPGQREVITSRRTLADLNTTLDEAAVRNSISAAATPLLVGDYEWVFESTDVEQFESGPGVSTYEILLPKDTALLDQPTVAKIFGTTQGWRDLMTQFFYRSTLNVFMVDYFDKTKRIADSLVDIHTFRKDAATLIVQIVNRSGTTVRFQTPDEKQTDGGVVAGEPAFKIPGRRLVETATDASLVTDPGSVATYGPRAYDLGGQSRWHQHPAAMAGIAGAVLGALGQPVPALESVEVPHDPRRNLYDDVLLTDEEGLGTVAGTVAGITTKYSKNGALDVLTVRPLAPPGVGLWDDPDLGRVGQTLRFGP